MPLSAIKTSSGQPLVYNSAWGLNILIS